MASDMKTPVAASTEQPAQPLDRFAAAKAARVANLERIARQERRGGAERERAPDMGGLRLKLSVIGEIPGHHLYWENDENGKIEELLYQGFDFVSPGEVQRASDLVADIDVSQRISRYVGRQEDGSPMRAYLLKCPEAIWQARQQAGADQANAWDAVIRNGRMLPTESSQYIPKGVNSSLQTNVRV